ncbi:CinA family protein [Aliikangiella maris]|uniref:CinA family protein n=2 Tax=Aliikangiella maris TaxID=3162458 RepID=A0ABV3MLH7_9GAMM
MQQLIEQLSEKLLASQQMAVTVESCTGGGIGKALTDVAGSSAWFAGGLITYTNESKTQLAGVSATLIQENGAVSQLVAEAMAQGALQHFHNTVSVAVSGVAGPGGGTPDKPVGTVCIATCANQQVFSKRFLFDGDRQQIREQTIEQAIVMLIEALSSTK